MHYGVSSQGIEVSTMGEIDKKYQRGGKVKPCSLDRDDILKLAEIIQETFTKPEIDRCFRVSTTIGSNRVFSNNVKDLLAQKEMGDNIQDLSFWIEGWDNQMQFDKSVLLDFSKYYIQLNVEGTDPLWVYDKYNKLIKFLNSKTSWYWPMVVMEKYYIFIITVILIINIIISVNKGDPSYYLDKLGLLVLWVFLVFSDTRNIWPYTKFRLKGASLIFNKENILMVGALLLLIAAILSGTVVPFMK
jgi:hypothetical protein